MHQLFLLGRVDLRDPQGAELRAVLVQPKRLAILAYLAIKTPESTCRRDELLGVFWPELSEDRARNALNKALHFLRHAIGDDAINSRGAEEIAVDRQHLWCDAVEFARAVESGRPADAIALYRGELLPAVYVEGAHEFDEWLEVERARLRRMASRAALALALEREREGNQTAAIEFARRAVELSDADERAVRQLVEILDRLGDRAGALSAYEEFAQRLVRDFGAEPAIETRTLMEHVRARNALQLARSDVTQAPAAIQPPKPLAFRRRRSLAAIGLAGVAIAVAVVATQLDSFGGIGRRLGLGPAIALPRVVVADFVEPANQHAGNVAQERVSDALSGSHNLTNVPRSQLVAARRAALLPDALGLALEAARHVALRSQIGTVVDGRVDRVGSKHSILLRAVSARDGRVISTARATASDSELSETIESLVRVLVRDIDQSGVRQAPRVSWYASTPSLEAYRLFLEAIEMPEGNRAMTLLQAALTVDSAFATAWHGLAMVFYQVGRGQDSVMFAYRQALKFGSRLSPAERLYVQGMMAYRIGENDEAVRLLDASLLEDGSNADVYHDRGMVLRNFGHYDEAATSFARAVELRPYAAEYWHNSLATTLAFTGKVDSARAVVSRMPAQREKRDAELYVAIASAQWDTVRRIALQFASDPGLGPGVRSRMYNVVAATQVAHGQIAAAWQTFREAELVLNDPFRFAISDVLIGIPTGARRSDRNTSMPEDTAAYHYYFRAVWHAWKRDGEAAKREIALFRTRLDPKHQAGLMSEADFLERWSIPGNEGLRNLIDYLAPIAWGGGFVVLGSNALQRWVVADAYERLGLVDSAAAYFDLLVRPTRIHFRQGEHTGFFHSYALRRLALLHERKGRRSLSRRYWQQFISVFTDPDPELRPLLVEAQTALARN
jgi:DNA-binding SARP family transcriptional activator/Tfp pilus assembly protein PilF